MKYGFNKDADICVASIGRCGSTMMTRFLISELGENRVFGVHARDFSEFNGKVVFIFGHPLDTVISTINRVPERTFSLHLKHMGVPLLYKKSVVIKEILVQDVLGLEELFDDWYRQHSFDMISVRYETLWDNIDAIGKFLGMDVSAFPVKKGRRTNWEKYPNKKILLDTYGRLVNKINSAKDIKIWSKI